MGRHADYDWHKEQAEAKRSRFDHLPPPRPFRSKPTFWQRIRAAFTRKR